MRVQRYVCAQKDRNDSALRVEKRDQRPALGFVTNALGAGQNDLTIAVGEVYVKHPYIFSRQPAACDRPHTGNLCDVTTLLSDRELGPHSQAVVARDVADEHIVT